jgi:hypothetical protein
LVSLNNIDKIIPPPLPIFKRCAVQVGGALKGIVQLYDMTFPLQSKSNKK